MTNQRVSPSTADYLTIALSPALVMTMVGSLVFFLLEVFYSGAYDARVRWIMFWFVMATVLVTRISMVEGAQQAGVYGVVLALATALVLARFVDAVLLAWLLLAVAWWCAHMLTRDCTHIDESEDVTGEGLLRSAGLDDSPAVEAEQHVTKPAVGEQTESPAVAGRPPTAWDEPRAALVQSFSWRPREKRTRAPGVWVVYFSLAALPLFGFGQLLIPVADVASRRYAFGLLCIYLASGLGLLLTTTFLGLRRYLRQRRLEMPPAMTGVWLSIGGVTAVAVLLLAALLPRPQAEYPMSTLTGLTGSREYQASRLAMLRDSPARGEGRASNRVSEDPSAQKTVEGKSGSSGGQKPQHDQSGDQSGGEGQGKSDADAKQHDDRSSDREGTGEDTDPKDAQQDEGQEEDGDSAQQGSAEKRQQGGSRSSSRNDSGQSSQTTSSPSPTFPPSPGGALLLLMKWLLYAVLIAAGLYFLWHHWRDVVAWLGQLVEMLSNFWRRLFGGGSRPANEADETEQRLVARPFSAFSDPFVDGTVASRSVDELVRYSFDALQAWAQEHTGARRVDETPIEFCKRVAASLPGASRDVRELGAMYAGSTYGRISPATSCRETLRRLWRAMAESVGTTTAPANALAESREF